MCVFRNYHVFYYLLAGASEEERKSFHLLKPEEYHYLNQVRSHKYREHMIQCMNNWQNKCQMIQIMFLNKRRVVEEIYFVLLQLILRIAASISVIMHNLYFAQVNIIVQNPVRRMCICLQMIYSLTPNIAVFKKFVLFC